MKTKAALKFPSQEFTPKAVELCHDEDFWPSLETTHQAMDAAFTIKKFVLDRLPEEMKPEGV